VEIQHSKSVRFQFPSNVIDLLQPAMFIIVSESWLLDHVLGLDLLKLEQALDIFQYS